MEAATAAVTTEEEVAVAAVITAAVVATGEAMAAVEGADSLLPAALAAVGADMVATVVAGRRSKSSK